MKNVMLLGLLLGLLLGVQSVDVFMEYSQAARHKKGLTFTTTVFPE